MPTQQWINEKDFRLKEEFDTACSEEGKYQVGWHIFEHLKDAISYRKLIGEHNSVRKIFKVKCRKSIVRGTQRLAERNRVRHIKVGVFEEMYIYKQPIKWEDK